jgi:hypothetical protein
MLSPAEAAIQTFWVSARFTGGLPSAASAIVRFDFGGTRGRKPPNMHAVDNHNAGA